MCFCQRNMRNSLKPSGVFSGLKLSRIFPLLFFPKSDTCIVPYSFLPYRPLSSFHDFDFASNLVF